MQLKLTCHPHFSKISRVKECPVFQSVGAKIFSHMLLLTVFIAPTFGQSLTEALRESLARGEVTPEWILRLQGGQPAAIESLLSLTPEQLEKLKELQAVQETAKVEVPPETLVTTPEELSPIEKIYQEGIPYVLSREILQFGYDAFKNITTNPPQSLSVPVSSDYILGPGDEVVINVWGKMQQTFRLTIDRDGRVFLPKVGAVSLWGKTFSEAQEILKKNVLQYYSGVNLDITLGKLRSVQVFLLGEVRRPGIVSVPPLSTPFQVLLLGGGVKKSGSLRKIKWIHRKSGKADYVDLYDLLVWGKSDSLIPFEDGDVIFVPPIGDVVGIAGNVRRPAIYELKNGEDLSELLRMAGGLGPVAFTGRIQVERIKGHKRRIVLDVKMGEGSKRGLHFKVQDGDFVLVFPVSPKKRKFVSIRGNVVKPGDYEWKPGMRVSDLIKMADGLEAGTYMERAEILRYYSGKRRRIEAFNLGKSLSGDTLFDPLLKEWDIVKIYSIEDAIPPQYVTIDGAIYNPGRYELLPNMRLEDLIFQAGGFLRGASVERIEIFRFPINGKPNVLRVNYNEPKSRELLLEPDDYVYVKIGSQWLKTHQVSITGEVRYPGKYPIREKETLKDLIERAGGFTENAFPRGIVLIRQSVKTAQSKALAEFVRSTKMSLLQEEASLEKGGLTLDEIRERREYIKMRSQLIDLLTKIPVFGRVVLDFKGGDPFALTLEEGDSIYVPPIPNTVQIIGSVYNPSAVAYKDGFNMMNYIMEVGGFREEADKKHVYVLKASGRVVKNPRKIERGDAIIVPEKFKVKTPTRKLIQDVANIVYQLSFAVLALYSVTKR